MKILYIQPLMEPEIIETNLEIDEIYRLINTDIYERCWFFEDDVCLICDECGWYHDYQILNRHIRQTVIKGPFILCCEENGEYCSLKEQYIEKYMELFRRPEIFTQYGNSLYYRYI